MLRMVAAILGLCVMVVGLLFVAFGARSTTLPDVICGTNTGCVGSVAVGLTNCVPVSAGEMTCSYHSPTDYTLNYWGGFVAITGAFAFGFAYPTKPTASLSQCRSSAC